MPPPAAAIATTLESALNAAALAHDPWSRTAPADRAPVLEHLARALDAHRSSILNSTHAETALTLAELSPEFDRMTGTLRLFASALREGNWLLPVIDTPAADHIGPNNDLRRDLLPLGPVAVFGASNFPLAYGVCGGDTASALAAGCAVIVKEHPAHPLTGRLIASIAREALADRRDLLHYIANEDPRDHSIAAALLASPVIAAVGFTGSLRAGLAIESLARQRPTPIPVFAEMGSTNPVLLSPRAATRSAGEALADSILARFGQQCTCPGLIFLPRASATAESLKARFDAAPARRMLAPWIRDAFLARLRDIAAARGITPFARGSAPADPSDPRAAHARLFRCDLADFAREATLHEEAFGPAAFLIEYDSPRDLLSLHLPASLTLTINVDRDDPADLDLARQLLARFASNAGRIIFSGVPTGVRVAHAMVHGGPFAATNRPDSTAVGPFAVARWCRPICYQNCPDSLLPPALQNSNPSPRLFNSNLQPPPHSPPPPAAPD